MYRFIKLNKCLLYNNNNNFINSPERQELYKIGKRFSWQTKNKICVRNENSI